MAEEILQHVACCCKTFFSYVASIIIIVILIIVLTGYEKVVLSKFRKVFFAALFNLASKKYNEVMDEHKKRLFASLEKNAAGKACGLKVLEIGAGSGANFKYYPPGTSITCVEPNDSCESYLRKNLSELGDKLILEEFKVACAEDLTGVESESMDAVVSTLVLCSVTDVDKCLKEVIRVLKPGGKFYFLEHIIEEEDSPLYNSQKNFASIHWFLMECRLNQATHIYIDKAGFSHVEKEIFHAMKLKETFPRIFGPWIALSTRQLLGTATK